MLYLIHSKEREVINMRKEICFDMDGTIANLYGVEGWLEDLTNKNPRPYAQAKPMMNFSSLARLLNRLQREGYKLTIISWLAKNSTDEYDELVTQAKMKWLKKHLPSVKWDNIKIVPYGTDKSQLGRGILFDDEQGNRENWKDIAFDVQNIIETLKVLG